jgi:hypothetical protein
MSEQLTQERRRAPRKRVLKGARIVFNNHRSTIDCLVRSLSKHGAVLGLPSRAGIPREFELLLDGELRPARIVWESGGKIGIDWV